MTPEEKRESNDRIFKLIQGLRLQNDLHVVEMHLEENQPTTSNPNEGIIRSFLTAAGNDIKASKTRTLNDKKIKIEREIQRHERKNSDLSSAPEITDFKWSIAQLFSSDIYHLERTLLSISIIFDKEYNYEYRDEGLSFISKIIWDDSQFILKIKSGVESIYKDLAKQPLTSNQKILLGGVSAALLFTSIVPTLAIGGLSASGITSGLAGFGTALGLGGTMVEGIALMTLAEFLLDSALIGFTYVLLDNHNKNLVKKSFREMDYNSVALMLAIKCYIMYIAKQLMPENVFKEKTSELLQMISDLKADTDYVLLVEKQNVEENKKKIQVFHNMDMTLSKIFC